MTIPTKYKGLLDLNGISLSKDFGIDDVALRKDDALVAIDILEASGVSILGGDVFFYKCGSVELAYANWFTEERYGESPDMYVARSCLESRRYIKDFRASNGMEPIFVLVIRTQE